MCIRDRISKLKERIIIIPGQMGIIGFANELFGEHITPSLSTVAQQTIRMGKSALNLLVDIMEKKEQHIKQKIVLDPLLICLLYTSDAADERSSVDLGGRRIIKKK